MGNAVNKFLELKQTFFRPYLSESWPQKTALIIIPRNTP